MDFSLDSLVLPIPYWQSLVLDMPNQKEHEAVGWVHQKYHANTGIVRNVACGMGKFLRHVSH